MNPSKQILLYVVFALSLTNTGCESIFLNEQSTDFTQWIKHAAAVEQCIPYEFATIEDALKELSQANIEVLSSKKIEFSVCSACFCPVGLEYYALIAQKQLTTAVEIGWTVVNDSTQTHSMTQ
tara:strand:- start:109 stop:477 length:369 start_codon:yes stop_codon:yes gene_type:complete